MGCEVFTEILSRLASSSLPPQPSLSIRQSCGDGLSGVYLLLMEDELP